MKPKTYEEAISELENIVSRLESGEADLDEALKLFEAGTKLAVFCNQKLESAEQKMKTLSQTLSESEAKAE